MRVSRCFRMGFKLKKTGCETVVANLYYCQPLLSECSADILCISLEVVEVLEGYGRVACVACVLPLTLYWAVDRAF